MTQDKRMQDQVARAKTFRSLHVPGQPLVLFNIWDPGSAKVVAATGAKALATGSWSVAVANGFEDGERIPLDLCIANLERIVAATDLPVTLDLESGYGQDAKAVGETIARVLKAGAIGCNLEDSFPESGELREATDHAERIRATRAAADRLGIPAFINARTDVFLVSKPDEHNEAMLATALERGHLYAQAGADGLFVPGLSDARFIGRLVEASPLPVNIMAKDTSPPLAELAKLGVARISHGPGPYRLMMRTLEAAARAALA
jgi:2-methylisocitrate lyase-like PEP mutase family enzyme